MDNPAVFDEFEAIGVGSSIISGAEIFRIPHLRDDAPLNFAQRELIARLHFLARFTLIVALLGLHRKTALRRRGRSKTDQRKRASRKGNQDTVIFHNDVMPRRAALNKL